MLIHSYLTNGNILVDFAILFLESFKKWNNENHRILFEGRDLSNAQIKRIKSNYKNIEIINRKIDYNHLSNVLKVPVPIIEKMKINCETKEQNVGTSGCVPWKQFVSVEDRYRNTLKNGLNYCKENDINHMVHFDIDTCFYSSLEPIEKIVEKHDVTLQFRSKRNRRLQKTRILGGFLGFKCNENSYQFVDKWIEIIDKISLKNKPKGYGQLSLYKTYNSMVDKIDIGEIPIDWSATRKNAKSWVKQKKNLIILNGSKGNKSRNIREFRKLLKEKK